MGRTFWNKFIREDTIWTSYLSPTNWLLTRPSSPFVCCFEMGLDYYWSLEESGSCRGRGTDTKEARKTLFWSNGHAITISTTIISSYQSYPFFSYDRSSPSSYFPNMDLLDKLPDWIFPINAFRTFCLAHNPDNVILVIDDMKRPRTFLQQRRVVGWPKR